jgi:uroporphyrin-III C-methyltransferase/precorrin-2 dehydrogenase/sirohydrochlorin ferrochelatase
MRYFPLFLDLAGRRVLVLGGGEQAAQKVRLLARTGARIGIVAERLGDELGRLVDQGRIRWEATEFVPSLLSETALLCCAGPTTANRAASASARDRGIPVNVVDDPEHSTFLMPAIVDRDPLVIAIGTEGAAPVLAQTLKARLEALLPPRIAELVRRAARLRERAAAAVPAGAPRRAFWRRFFFGPPGAALLAGDEAAFARAIEHTLGAAHEQKSGRVDLVGAGPGDPELLTLRAQRKLQEADVIVHDRLIGPEILEYARRDAERIAVGKTPGGSSTDQREINEILVREARKGRHVVRLKGGDPYIFGRGGEEQAALERAGIPFEVVPGVTAALACAASARLPLTQRGAQRSFTVLTGMTGLGPAEHDWASLARHGSAFALYMGVATAGHTARRLLEAGADPATPVTVVENGTLASERILDTTVAELPTTLNSHAVRGPAVIYVGLSRKAAPGAEVVAFPQADLERPLRRALP